MRKQIGKLLQWDIGAAKGVVQSLDRDEQYIVSRNLFPEKGRTPKIADRIILFIDIDDNGNKYINSAAVAERAIPRLMLTRILMGALFTLYMLGVYLSWIPFFPVATYIGLAVITALFFRQRSRKPVIVVLCLGIFLCHASFVLHIADSNDLLDSYRGRINELVDALVSKGRSAIELAADGFSAFASLVRNSQGGASEKTQYIEVYLPGPGSRSAVPVDKRLRIIKGLVSEVQPDLGVVVLVDLDVVATGLIPRETLVENFANRFVPGEEVFVAVDEITVNHSIARVDLLLLDDGKSVPAPESFVSEGMDGFDHEALILGY